MTPDDRRSSVQRVCVESPLAGDYERNVLYADACLLDCLNRGEAPFLGHLLYPRVLRDQDPGDRAHGIAAHCAWLRCADVVVAYRDLGVSAGMQLAVNLAREIGVPVCFRELGPGWMERIAYVRPTRGF